MEVFGIMTKMFEVYKCEVCGNIIKSYPRQRREHGLLRAADDAPDGKDR